MTEKVRIGFVGLGNMGQMAHLRNYALIDDCEVVAAAELRQNTAQLVAQRYGIKKVYKDHKRFRPDGIRLQRPSFK